MQGNQILAQFDVMQGLTTDQDGYNFYPSWDKKSNFYDLEKQAMVTPSGIFTLASSSYKGKPAFRFVEGERGNSNKRRRLSAMMHIMPGVRQSDFNKGIRNRSYGCVNLPQKVLNYMTKNGASNDSLYVLPTREGNFIYESSEKGHPLKTYYGNAPERIQGKHYAAKYDLPVTYNKGY